MKKPILIEIIIWTILLAIIFSGIIFTYSKIFVEPNIYTIQFKDIDGITEGSPVRFMGLNVGYVRKLKSQSKHVNVQILITKKDMKIPNGTVARIEFYGLGGSKSVELMPPDGSCDVGILTDSTIRIADIIHEAAGLVRVVEEIEKYVKGLDKAGMEKFLETVVDFKLDNIKSVNDNMSEFNTSQKRTIENIKTKQNDFKNKIDAMDVNVEKINKFIKR